jgi:hypothetical protein
MKLGYSISGFTKYGVCMKYKKRICIIIGMLLIFSPTVTLANAVPVGYGTAYKTYRSNLTPAERLIPWLRFDGLESESKPITMAGRRVLWSSSCKPHDCGANIVFVFWLDRKHATAVIYRGGTGVPRLVGGAGRREVACVNALFNTGWEATHC